jgi:hypothetical protein
LFGGATLIAVKVLNLADQHQFVVAFLCRREYCRSRKSGGLAVGVLAGGAPTDLMLRASMEWG